MIDEPIDHTKLARLGRGAHGNRRTVFIVWAVLAIGLGAFAPKLEHSLSGAMREVKGSDSLAARKIIDLQFSGRSSQSAAVVIHSDTVAMSDPAFQKAITEATAVLATEKAMPRDRPQRRHLPTVPRHRRPSPRILTTKRWSAVTWRSN